MLVGFTPTCHHRLTGGRLPPNHTFIASASKTQYNRAAGTRIALLEAVARGFGGENAVLELKGSWFKSFYNIALLTQAFLNAIMQSIALIGKLR
jgi:hypothetical protein